MKRVFQLYAKKKLILSAYLGANHWIAVVILLKQKRVLYLDSLKSLKTNISLFSLIINSKFFLSYPSDIPQQTLQSIFIVP
jgi:Ulp1 family protease